MYTYDRRAAAAASKDKTIMLDLFDLTGDHTPVSLADLLKDNQESPLPDEELEALRKLHVGQKTHLGIGGGAVEIKRVR